MERSVDPALHYVDEDWMGCAGIAFARSTDGGRHLDAPISPPGTVRLVRVTPDVDHAAHIVEVTGGRAGVVYVGRLTNSSPKGYSEYLRKYSIPGMADIADPRFGCALR